MGFWPYSDTKIGYYSTTCLSFLYDIFTIIPTFGVMYQLTDYTDMMVFTEGILLSSTGMRYVIKSLINLNKRKELREIIRQINELYVTDPNDSNQKVKNEMEGVKSRYYFLTKIYIAMPLLVCILYDAAPWFIYFKTGEKRLPYPMKYPFDTDRWDVHLFLYFACLMVGFRVIVCFPCDTMFAGFITVICTRYDVFFEALRKSIDEAKATNDYRNKFKECVIYQKKILK